MRGIVIDQLMKQYQFKTLMNTREIFVYKDGIFESNGLPEQICREAIRDGLGYECIDYDENEVIGAIKTLTGVDGDYFDEIDSDYIGVENGVLDLIHGNLEPFDIKYRLRNKIPVEWRDFDELDDAMIENGHKRWEGRRCIEIDRFFHEIMDDGNPETTEMKVKTLYQFFAYCLYRGYPIHKAFLLVGYGANGKTTLLNLLETFLNENNVSNTALQNLGDRFATARLRNKLANLFDDLEYRSLQYTGYFKIMVGGGWVDAEIKNVQRPFKFKNYAKLIFSCNKIPPNPNDDTNAFWRRWIILNLTNTFTEEKGNHDANILKKLTEPFELSCLLWECVKELHYLMLAEKFAWEQTPEEVESRWTKDTEQEYIKGWIEIATQTEWILKYEVFQSYKTFCFDNNFTPDAQEVFHKKFKQQINCIEKRLRINGIEQKVYHGVRFRLTNPVQQLLVPQ